VFGGSGHSGIARKALADFTVDARWSAFIRFNFTLDD
jgi:hypothetical protein